MFKHLKNKQKQLALLLPFLLLISCEEAVDKSNKANSGNLSVEAVKITAEPFNNEVKTTADLLPNEQATLMAPMAGQVLDIYFKEGASIRKGEKIIRIYDKDWQAQLVGLTPQLETAQKDLERKKALLDIGGSTQEEIDKIYASTEALKSQIQQLKLNIELANVRAPFSGVLGMRDFSEGTFLKEGQEITTLTEVKQLKVNFTLPQEYLSNVQINTEVRILIGKDTLPAKVYAVNPVINIESRTINVRALLKQPAGKSIMPGSFAEVIVSTDFVKDALLVPTQAVVPEINDQTVYVYSKGKAIRKTVILGTRTADRVRVISGISSGDTIITSGLLQVKDGMGVDLQILK